MATLMINAQMMNNLLVSDSSGLFRNATPSTGTSNLVSSNAAGSALIVYQGTMPDINTFTNRSQRAADELIVFSLPAYASASTIIGNVGNATFRIASGKTTTSVTAIGTGIATWFIACATFDTSLTNKSVLMGAVGLPGSGAELVISDTFVTAGRTYDSLGYTINFPFQFTV